MNPSNPSSLLFIQASPRGERSVSRRLAQEYLTAWQAAHPGAPVIVRDLAVQTPPPITEAWIAGTHTPPAEHSAEARAAVAISDELADEFLAATEIAIATPIFNFHAPGVLKLWIDQIVRQGRSYVVDENGLRGLATGRRVKVLVASGGDLRPGQPMGGMNFLEPHLRGLFGFIGITDLEFVYAHSQAYDDGREKAVDEAVALARLLAAA